MKKQFAKIAYILIFFCYFGSPLFGDITSTRKILSDCCLNNSDVLNAYDGITKSCDEYNNNSDEQWNFEKLLKAIEFAAKKHQGQVRKDIKSTPYIIHPIGVADLLWRVGNIRSINVLTSAILHDTLEDTNAKESEINILFGPRVLYTVKEVTNDSNLSSAENKQRQVNHAPNMSLDGQLVKLADRLYNVMDLKNPPSNWSVDKINGYYEWGDKLLKSLKGTNASLESELGIQIKNHRNNN